MALTLSSRLIRSAACWRLGSRGLSSAPPQERLLEVLLRYGKKVSAVKLAIGAIGGLGALVAADPIYVLWKASRCDLPERKEPLNEIRRESEVQQLRQLMDMTEDRSFVVLSGTPGVGKTTAVVSAARQRGTGVLYINGAAASTVDKVIQKIVKAYGSPMDVIRRTSDPGWMTLTRAADWYFWWYGRKLVVVIDHIDRVKGAEYLLEQAKTAADEGKLLVLFIASEGIPDLRKTSAYQTRARDTVLGPVSVKSVKDLLKNVAPDNKAQWDEVIYLSGCNLSDVWYYIHGLRGGYSLPVLQRLREENISLAAEENLVLEQEDLKFWESLLEAGASGLKVSSREAAKVKSNKCCRIINNRVYFRHGVCSDLYASLLNFKIPERKFEGPSEI